MNPYDAVVQSYQSQSKINGSFFRMIHTQVTLITMVTILTAMGTGPIDVVTGVV